MGGRAAVRVAALVSFALLGCSFPSVEYAASDSGSDATTTCTVPSDCSTPAVECKASANTAYGTCVSSCGSDTTCGSRCQTALQDARSACASACEQCALDYCQGAPTSCGTLTET